MAEYFDSSPRASKRRRTITPKRPSSTLQKEIEVLDPRTKRLRGVTVQGGASEDSTYGSKEDSLIEEDTHQVASFAGDHDVAMADDGDSSITIEMKSAQSGRSTRRKQATPPPDAAGSGEDENTISVQPRSSGRERRKPRRYSLSPEQPRKRNPASVKESNKEDSVVGSASKKQTLAVQVTPKGILTPSRREKRTGPRKSVNFDRNDKEIEEQFGFKDIQGSTRKTSSSAKQNVAQPPDEEVNGTPSKKPGLKRWIPPTREPESEPEAEIEELFVQDIIEEPAIAIPDALEGTTVDDWNLEDDHTLLQIKSEVLTRLTSRGMSNGQAPSHLQSQYNMLHALLHATVTNGESNSLLLLGARGSGKIHLLQTALAELNKERAGDFHVVRLNGFFQTDDKVALREIWRQLGREMQVDEMETGETGASYADTMSSLLSLLSHPDEFVDPATMEDGVMAVDQRPVRTSKSIIFILDEFDLFTTHPRQTLLYNLFDIAQSKKAPIAVVGCSTRMDVVDCLEKRVKSRFSHRWLHVPSVRTLDGFEDIVKSMLCVDLHLGITAMRFSKKDIEARGQWNDYIRSTFLASKFTQTLVKSFFYTTKSIPDLFAALYIPIALLRIPSSSHNNSSSSSHIGQTCTSISPSILALLSDLPTLQLALLVAAARLDTIHNLTTLNFNLVYAHYVELISRSKLQITAAGAVAVGASLRQWNRDTARCAWEDLGLHECIVPVSGAVGVGAGSKDASSVVGDSIGGEGANVRMWRVDVTLDELEWAVKEKWDESGGLRDVLLKWCKEI